MPLCNTTTQHIPLQLVEYRQLGNVSQDFSRSCQIILSINSADYKLVRMYTANERLTGPKTPLHLHTAVTTGRITNCNCQQVANVVQRPVGSFVRISTDSSSSRCADIGCIPNARLYHAVP